MVWVAIVSVVVAGVAVVLNWISTRKTDVRAAKRYEAEVARRAEEVAHRESLLPAILEIYRTSGGNLKVINSGPEPATGVGIQFAEESEVRLVGANASRARDLGDLKLGASTVLSIKPASGDARIRFTLYWKDPRGHQKCEIDCDLKDLQAEAPTPPAIARRPPKPFGRRSIRPQPRRPGF